MKIGNLRNWVFGEYSFCVAWMLVRWHSGFIITSAEPEVRDSRRSGMYQSRYFQDKIGHAKSVGFRFYSAIWQSESRISSRCLEITSISLIYSLTLLFWLFAQKRFVFVECYVVKLLSCVAWLSRTFCTFLDHSWIINIIRPCLHFSMSRHISISSWNHKICRKATTFRLFSIF